MGIIKYIRAKNSNDEIVNIEEVSPEMRKATKFTYFCKSLFGMPCQRKTFHFYLKAEGVSCERRELFF